MPQLTFWSLILALTCGWMWLGVQGDWNRREMRPAGWLAVVFAAVSLSSCAISMAP